MQDSQVDDALGNLGAPNSFMGSRMKSDFSASKHSASPAVTPEIRQWIVAQAQAGHDAPSLLRAMLQAGWQEDVAVEIMESTLGDHLEDLAVQEGLAARSQVPEPDLADSPLFVDAGDRQVAVLMAMVRPRVVVFGDLLSEHECSALIELSRPRLARSRTVATQTGGDEVNADRTSDGMFFSRGETELLQRIEARIAKLVNWPVENGEGLQILRYRPGAEYKPHYDYFNPDEPGTPSILQRGGQRVGTLVIYLNQPEKGGGTTFPELHLEVMPQRGHAVFFNYKRPHPSTRTLHGGSAVLAGEKWIATKWLREREFR
jgi:prolyl 4-hydroxylase